MDHIKLRSNVTVLLMTRVQEMVKFFPYKPWNLTLYSFSASTPGGGEVSL